MTSSYKKADKLAPLASSTDDVGLMQVNRITWRSLYDLNGLNGDSAAMETQAQKFCITILRATRFRKKEHAQKNGNLARATYSAYSRSWGARTLSRRATDSGLEKSRPRILGQISNRKLGQRACGQRLLHN
jgi:hypothetical protein